MKPTMRCVRCRRQKPRVEGDRTCADCRAVMLSSRKCSTCHQRRRGHQFASPDSDACNLCERQLEHEGAVVSARDLATKHNLPLGTVIKRYQAGRRGESLVRPLPIRATRGRARHDETLIALADMHDPGSFDSLPFERDARAQFFTEIAVSRGGLTCEDIAVVIGCSRERVRQIVEGALRKLNARNGELLDYLWLLKNTGGTVDHHRGWEAGVSDSIAMLRVT